MFSITPGKPDRGTLFDYGADFYQIGKQTGELAVRILRGADPGQIPITNLVPTLLVVNTQALKGLKDSWRVPDDLLGRADVVVDGEGIHRKRSAATANLAEQSDNEPEDATTGHFPHSTQSLCPRMFDRTSACDRQVGRVDSHSGYGFWSP